MLVPAALDEAEFVDDGEGVALPVSLDVADDDADTVAVTVLVGLAVSVAVGLALPVPVSVPVDVTELVGVLEWLCETLPDAELEALIVVDALGDCVRLPVGLLDGVRLPLLVPLGVGVADGDVDGVGEPDIVDVTLALEEGKAPSLASCDAEAAAQEKTAV